MLSWCGNCKINAQYVRMDIFEAICFREFLFFFAKIAETNRKFRRFTAFLVCYSAGTIMDFDLQIRDIKISVP